MCGAGPINPRMDEGIIASTLHIRGVGHTGCACVSPGHLPDEPRTHSHMGNYRTVRHDEPQPCATMRADVTKARRWSSSSSREGRRSPGERAERLGSGERFPPWGLGEGTAAGRGESEGLPASFLEPDAVAQRGYCGKLAELRTCHPCPFMCECCTSVKTCIKYIRHVKRERERNWGKRGREEERERG